MVECLDLGSIMPKFINENPWFLTHEGQCCVDDVVKVTDDLYEEITQLRAENERLRAENAELKQDISDMDMEMRVMGEYE